MEFKDSIAESLIVFDLISINKHANMASCDIENFFISTTLGTHSKSDFKYYTGVCFVVIRDQVIINFNGIVVVSTKTHVLKKYYI